MKPCAAVTITWTEVQRLRFDDCPESVVPPGVFHFRGADHVHYPAQVPGAEEPGGEARSESEEAPPDSRPALALYGRINLAVPSCMADSSCSVKE